MTTKLQFIIIIEFFTSQLCLGNSHLSWDAVINRIRLFDLICSLKSFLQLNMCQELQTFFICIHVFGCRLSLVRLCDSDFGITPVDDITIGITCAAFCFHIAYISFASSWYLFCLSVTVLARLLLLLLLRIQEGSYVAIDVKYPFFLSDFNDT